MKLLLYPVLLFVTACTGQTNQNDNYYFPVKNCFNEKTYCYVNQTDSTEKSYWKLKTIVSNIDTLLQTTILDSKNRISEVMVEKILNGISKISTYTLYNYDQQGIQHKSECKIIDSVVFIEGQKANTEIQWKVIFKGFNSSDTCELTKTRILMINRLNQSTFTDLMKFEVLSTKQGYQYHMTSVYEKDKGLVSYKLSFPGEKVKDYILMNIK
jgi:hypothetical protein